MYCIVYIYGLVNMGRPLYSVCMSPHGKITSTKVHKQVLQIANPKICGIKKFARLVGLPQMWSFADLRFLDPQLYVICGLRIVEERDRITKICGFAFSKLAHIKNLWICCLRINHKNLRICDSGVANLINLQICD